MNPTAHTVLLVEDSEDDVLLIQRAFNKANLMNPIRVLDDGEKAVEYLAGNGIYSDRTKYPIPVFILLDLKLPRRSGLEVLEWLRGRDDDLRRLPVVMLTSSNEAIDVNKAYDLGVNSYLRKPVGFDALFDLIKVLHPYWMILNERPELAV